MLEKTKILIFAEKKQDKIVASRVEKIYFIQGKPMPSQEYNLWYALWTGGIIDPYFVEGCCHCQCQKKRTNLPRIITNNLQTDPKVESIFHALKEFFKEK